MQFSPLTGHADVHDLAAEVLRHAPDQFAICGLSMGGIVAMEVLRQAPMRVRGLALLDTNPFAELDSVKQRRTPQMEKVRAGKLLDVMRDEMKPNYLAEGARYTEIFKLCTQMALELGSDVFIRQSMALRDRPDQSETLRTVSCPTLVLCGEQDRLCPPERHRTMHEMVHDSTLAIIDKAGHLPVLEQPSETNAHLQIWLQACDRLAGSGRYDSVKTTFANHSTNPN